MKTIDPAKALGKPHTIWVDFAKYYEEHGDVKNARAIFDRAEQSPFRAADDLAAAEPRRERARLQRAGVHWKRRRGSDRDPLPHARERVL